MPPQEPTADQPTRPAAPPPPRRRWWRWILGTPLLLGVLLTGSALYLVNTETGLRWLFDLAAAHTPGTLGASRVDGRLTGPLHLEDLALALADGTRVHITRLDIDWHPRALLDGELKLLGVHGSGIILTTPGGEETPPGEPFSGISLPLGLTIEALTLETLELRFADAGPLALQRIELAGGARAERVRIERLAITSPLVDVTLQGGLGLSPELPLEVQTHWSYRPPEGGALTGAGPITGDLRRLTLHQRIEGALSGNLQGEVRELQGALSWGAELSLEQGDLTPYLPAFPAQLSGALRAGGDLQRQAFKADLALREPRLGQLNAELEGALEAGRLEIGQLRLDSPQGTRVDGNGQWQSATGAFDLDLSWNGLRWPLSGEQPQVRSDQGQLQLNGTPEDYSHRCALRLAAPQLPPLRLEARGEGDLEEIRFEHLAAHPPQGVLEGRGSFAWAPHPAWRLELEGRELDPGLLLPELPGRIALRLRGEGALPEQGLESTLDLERLNGTLRGYPLQGSGSARLVGDELTLHGITLSTGENRVEAEGRIGRTLDLRWRLDAPALDQAWPGLSGHLRGQGTLSGTPGNPAGQGRIEGSELGYGDWRLEGLNGEMALTAGADGPVSLELEARRPRLADQRWERLGLTLSGRRQQHRVALHLTDPAAPSIELTMDGALDPAERWRGQITDLAIRHSAAGAWRLEQPAALALQAGRVALAPACLSADPGQLCLEVKGDPGAAWSGSLQGRRLPLDLLAPWLDPLHLSGEAELELELEANPSGRLSGTAQARIPRGALQVDALQSEVGAPTKTLDLSGSSANARLNAQGAEASLQLPVAGLGRIEGGARLPGLRPDTFAVQRQRIEGELRVEIPDLAPLAWTTPHLSAVQGRATADFQLAGTLEAPRIEGQAQLTGGAAELPVIGLRLEQIEARLQAPDPGRLRYQVALRCAEGNMELEGETRLDAAADWPGTLRLRGQECVAVDIPEAKVWLSPDLTLRRERGATHLEGDLSIPRARLRPGELPKGAATGSADLVVVENGKPVEEQGRDLQLHTRIRLRLGDQVNFEGFGLRADLGGDLTLIDEPGRPVLGNGALNIDQGSYRAYGQDLTIEHGRVLYAETPVDNPALELRAIRKSGQITSGIRVDGTLKKPRLALFSRPPMSQSETLSYLLTGQPPGAGGSLDQAALSAALAAGGAGSLSGEIARQVGLDELRLETGQQLGEASVVAGTWLSPRLYAQYVNNLGVRESRLRLRYDLTERLQIQTESGTGQGIDLFYTIED
ncbi:MAG: DUF490 domain-containing protein [Candidatus Sedimenticola endophacoides]|uniref:DUF490 domain-containing protein n=1 Tax=Candidatus Sedimenticola endophacoides TaxID=2548426 RepID=A0A6N4DN65_9GAMM|nr:MAG: DUF490 domain-containing protein [Candidatus Sedimenticola endophacoides]PUE01520.1 MAG: DUF490 domain-containing protein [Candidatus Sedimenticola endophacoides]PUE04064.1 MAG: DUF490 domain-containing protein [Candidatus Sedimenticola endophacoides]